MPPALIGICQSLERREHLSACCLAVQLTHGRTLTCRRASTLRCREGRLCRTSAWWPRQKHSRFIPARGVRSHSCRLAGNDPIGNWSILPVGQTRWRTCASRSMGPEYNFYAKTGTLETLQETKESGICPGSHCPYYHSQGSGQIARAQGPDLVAGFRVRRNEYLGIKLGGGVGERFCVEHENCLRTR